MSQQQHIFISYSRRNTDIMVTIRQILAKSGFRVWTDENLVAGTPSWKNAIEQAIQNSFCVVVLMSPDSKKSEWVERELDYAYMLKRRIFPALIEGTPQTAIPFELINIQYVDLRVDLDDSVVQLVSGLQVFLESQVNFIVPEQATPVSDDIEAKVEARVNQLIGNLPEDIREKIDLPAKNELENREESEPELEMPDIPIKFDFGFSPPDEDQEKRLAHNLQLMKWYFVAPQKLSRFRRIFLNNAPTELNAFLTIGMIGLLIWIVVLAFSWEFIMFYGCGTYILIMVGMGITSYGSPKSSYSAYIWSILKAAMIIVFILGILAVATVMSSLIYYIY